MERANRRDSRRGSPLSLESSSSQTYDGRLRFDHGEVSDTVIGSRHSPGRQRFVQAGYPVVRCVGGPGRAA